jgi:RHS repeat-associated protein
VTRKITWRRETWGDVWEATCRNHAGPPLLLYQDVLRTMKGTPGKLLLYGPGDERIWEFAYTNGQDPATFRETFSLRGLGGQVLREYQDIGGNSTGNWSLAEEFIYRDGQLLASVTPTQTTHFTLDHLGTPRLATGNAGVTLAYHAYFPFGEEASNPNQNTQRMKFTGHQRDNLGGGVTDDLDYMHARYGSPMTGRFLSVDPVLGSPGDPQSWNRYAYVLGNPLKLVDRNGRFPWLLFGLGMAGGFFSAEAANAPTRDPNEVLIPNSDGGKQIAGAAAAAGAGLGATLLNRAAWSFATRYPELYFAAFKVLTALSDSPASNVRVPGPTNSRYGKLDYLLGLVPGSERSAGKAGTFAKTFGFTRDSLEAALKSHLIKNIESAVLSGSRVVVDAPMTGANGEVRTVRSVWQILSDGTISLITAFETKK